MDELKPEERARIKIDEQLVDAGWHIANRGGVTYDHNAVALVEGLLDGKTMLRAKGLMILIR